METETEQRRYDLEKWCGRQRREGQEIDLKRSSVWAKNWNWLSKETRTLKLDNKHKEED